MFNKKLLFFIFFLLFGKVDNEPNCEEWYLEFPTKFQCEEFYRHSRTTTTSTSITTTTTKIATTKVIQQPTSTSSTMVTPAENFVPTLLPDIQTPEEYPTSISTVKSTTPTTTEFVPTLHEPTTADNDDFTTETEGYIIITRETSTVFSTTISQASNSARNKTPWYMSLWAYVAYGILAVFFVSGLGVTVFQRVRRINIQASYARLHGDIQMDPIREIDEENSSQGSSGDPENPNATESTLVAPPSQSSSLTVVNPRYRMTSTSLHSSDESINFQSANSSSNLVSTQNETQVSVTVHQPAERQSPPSSPIMPTPQSVSPIQPSLNIPPASGETPATEPSPRASTPTNLVDRFRDTRRSEKRSETNKKDPTRRQPSRKAKKNMNYKE